MNGKIYVSVTTKKQMEDVIVNHGFDLETFYETNMFKVHKEKTVLELISNDWFYCSIDDVKPNPLLSYEDYMEKFGRSDKAETPEEDMINHPSHYNSYSFEVIDIIDEVVPNFDSSVAGHIQNAIKYIVRAPFNGTEMEDLKKAAWYLNHAIELENNHERK